MEVKINKEIRQYTESIFFGLSLRQCICSVLACGSAVALYFIFKPDNYYLNLYKESQKYKDKGKKQNKKIDR